MLRERRRNSRDEIATIGIIVGMLKLAPAAFREMAAWRFLVVRPERQRAVVENRVPWHAERHVPPAWSDAVPARGNADDQFVHNEAIAAGIATARSSAISCGPAISAARP